jgi:hypothetical protein
VIRNGEVGGEVRRSSRLIWQESEEIKGSRRLCGSGCCLGKELLVSGGWIDRPLTEKATRLVIPGEDGVVRDVWSSSDKRPGNVGEAVTGAGWRLA